MRNILLLIITSLVLLITAELIMRLVYGLPPSTMDHFSLSKSNYYQKDDELGHVPRKNIRGLHSKKGSFSTTFRTNTRGLRDKEYTLTKTDGVSRIVIIGDSFTWGWGVNDDEIYTERLEAMLSNTETINLGVTAYSLSQEISYFQREGLRYNPDILMVGFYLDDIIRGPGRNVINKSVQQSKTSTQREVQKNRLRVKLYENMKKYVLHKSALYQFIVDRIGTKRTLVNALANIGVINLTEFEDLDTNLKPALKNYPAKINKCWEVTQSELLQLKQITHNKGIKLIIVIIPSPHSIVEKRFEDAISHSIYHKRDFDLDKPYSLLTDFASSNNIDLVNPIEVYRQAHKEGILLYLKKDVHINATGHEVLARVIADYLISTSTYK